MVPKWVKYGQNIQRFTMKMINKTQEDTNNHLNEFREYKFMEEWNRKDNAGYERETQNFTEILKKSKILEMEKLKT
jgi:hypothetical protein